MVQKRGVPSATSRSSDDYEWVNQWADASGLKAAQQFARGTAVVDAAAAPAAPTSTSTPKPEPRIELAANAVDPIARTAPAAKTPTTAASFPVAPDQLARDVAEIERARDAIIAAEGNGVFVLPVEPRRAAPTGLRRRDAVPMLIGALMAVFLLVLYAAATSIFSLGH